MVAGAHRDGNQTGFQSRDCLLPGGIFEELKDRLWPEQTLASGPHGICAQGTLANPPVQRW